MQHLYSGVLLRYDIAAVFHCMSNPGKVPRVHRIKPMLHRLCGPPSIPLSFTLASILPRRCTYRVSSGTEASAPAPSARRLQCGLPGYLILFDPHTFAPQRQSLARSSPSPLVFPDLYRFHPYTRNSSSLSMTQALQFPAQSTG